MDGHKLRIALVSSGTQKIPLSMFIQTLKVALLLYVLTVALLLGEIPQMEDSHLLEMNRQNIIFFRWVLLSEIHLSFTPIHLLFP